MASFKSIAIDEAEQLIAEQRPLLLDCRKLADYKLAHLDNAMHLHEKLRESLLMKADKHKPLLIYCHHGHASEHLAEMFADFGFSAVYSMAGGFEAWQQHHKPQGES